jgi:sugar/nucleoside kinase (ribokinase family)
MRTALGGAASLQAEQVRADAARFVGARWVSLTAFAYYTPGLVDAVVEVTRAVGARLVFHLASFEVVRTFLPQVRALLAAGHASIVFGNEDEARALLAGDEHAADPGACALPRDSSEARAYAFCTASSEAALRWLARAAGTAVVTLGSRGCIAMQGDTLVREVAVADVACVDSTGAGDLFAAGFMFGVLNDLALHSCVQLGCLSGAAVCKVCALFARETDCRCLC